MPLPTGLRALSHRDFRVFWSGQIVSLVGTWMQRVGQAWLVLELTNSAFKLGIISALQFAPVLLFSVPAGAIVDRVPKRRLLVATQSVLMLQAFVLTALVWTARVRYWHVAVLATVYGLANAFDIPTRQAFVADMVTKRDLMNAIALNSAMFNAARLIGPAVAGLLIARYGLAQAFLLNAVSFIAVIVALSFLRADGAPHPSPGTTMFEKIRGGLQYVGATPVIGFVLALLLSVGFFVINFNVLVPLITKQVLHAGAREFGWLMASLGGGAIAGALSLAYLIQGRPPIALPVAAGLAVSAGTIVLAAVERFPTAVGLLIVIGFSQIVFQASCNTMLQVTVPDALRGRIMSFYALVFAGATPLGSLAVGSIAEKFGVSGACALGGAGGVLSVAILTSLWTWGPRHGRVIDMGASTWPPYPPTLGASRETRDAPRK
jgi:predicted MFS family arabinose efflux permease